MDEADTSVYRDRGFVPTCNENKFRLYTSRLRWIASGSGNGGLANGSGLLLLLCWLEEKFLELWRDVRLLEYGYVRVDEWPKERSC